MEHCIVYFSTSVGLFEEEDLMTILEQSHRNNADLDITGVLLYVRGSIIQVLEGDKEKLDVLYQRIAQDRRHKNVMKVVNRSIDQRLFPHWRMGYETLTDRQLDEIRTVINFDSNKQTTQAGDNVILKMIKLFYDSNRRN